MSQKITCVTIEVPYKGAGGVIRQHEVTFDLFKATDHYSLVPCLSQTERQLANLPEKLSFTMQGDKPISLRRLDGNFHVIRDVVTLLQKQNIPF